MKKVLLIIVFVLFSVLSYSQDLSKTVAIHADGASLKDVCEYLSMQTKTEIKAGKTENDWSVYDRKAVIHVENISLKDLMSAMANVFNMTWEADENGTIYLCYTDEQKENDLKKREEYFLNEKNQFLSRQETSYNAIINKTSDTNYGNLLYNSDYYNKIIDFLNAFPQLQNVIMNKESMKFNYSQLTDKQKNALQALTYSYIDFNAKMYPQLREQITIFQNSDKLTIFINTIKSSEEKDIESEAVFARVLVKDDKNNSISLDILNPNSEFANYIALSMADIEKGESYENVLKRLEVNLIQYKAQMIMKNKSVCENIQDFEDKLDLAQLTGRKAMNYKEFYSMLYDKANVNIVSDYYYRDTYEFDTVPQKLSSIIQNSCDQFQVNSNYRNNILELQDKHYYIKAAGIVPSAWIDYWVVRAYENGGYNIDDLINMGKLNDIQIDLEIKNNPDMNVYVDKDLHFNPQEVLNKRYTLRFLASLEIDFLKKLYEQQLSAYELTDEQWDLLQKALNEADGFYVPQKKASQSVSLKMEKGRVLEYHLKYISDFSTEPIDIMILSNRFTIKKNKHRK